MLTDKAMIVRLNVSQWTTRVFDRNLTVQTARDNAIDSRRLRTSKSLVAKEAIERIAQIAGSVRNYHYTVTLPWDDSNGRLLPCTKFEEYRSTIQTYKDQFRQAVADFLAEYDRYVDEAKAALKGAFNRSQYPSIDKLESKYRLDTSIEPIPLSGDFRVSLNSEEFEAVKRELEAAAKERETLAMQDLYRRLYDVVSKMAEKLKDSKAIFRDSLIGNVASLTELLPALNLTGDPTLEALRKDVVAKLTNVEPQTLRNDKKIRKQTAKSADDILSKLAGYVG